MKHTTIKYICLRMVHELLNNVFNILLVVISFRKFCTKDLKIEYSGKL
jgi:hypothetical protein